MSATCECGHPQTMHEFSRYDCDVCGQCMFTPAAVPDREVDPLDASGSDEHVDAQHALAATEQLAALVREAVKWHVPLGVGGNSVQIDRITEKVVAVIVAAGWRKA